MYEPEKYRKVELCEVCLASVVVMCFMGTGVCCNDCLKERDEGLGNEADIHLSSQNGRNPVHTSGSSFKSKRGKSRT